jgi:predicted transcriptional regulator
MNRKIILTCRLTDVERDTLNRYADAARIETSTIVRTALNEYIQRHPVAEQNRTWSRA